MALNLLRNARLFVSTVGTQGAASLTKSNTWEIPILGDFSFSQATETQDIGITETGSAPTRGMARFNTALNPVEWSFSSYMRPYVNYHATPASERVRCMERILWHGLVSDNTVDWTTGPVASGASKTDPFTIAFTDSNVHKFTELFFYIKADNYWYMIKKVQVNQAEIDFSIDTIGQITWSGFGTTMEGITDVTADAYFAVGATAVCEYSSPLVANDAVSDVGTKADFIIQRYTSLVITDNRSTGGHSSQAYTLPITGGSLTINNNITYLTPETLGVVNTPVGSFTGSRDISGSATVYLRTGAAGDAGDLLNDLLGFTSETTNTFKVELKAGGTVAPYVFFDIPHAHLTIPTVDVQDVLSATIEFKALPYTGTGDTTKTDLTAVNDMTVKYYSTTETTDTEQTD